MESLSLPPDILQGPLKNNLTFFTCPQANRELRLHKKELRTGYTTGACAAAAAKAAAMLLVMNYGLKVTGENRDLTPIHEVEIPFPDGSRVRFKVHDSGISDTGAWASVIKDAGDDPDVTDRAEIKAEARFKNREKKTRNTESAASIPPTDNLKIEIRGGKGVGVVTKPGLPVSVGEPAINPVPRRMITEAVLDGIRELAAKAKNLSPITHHPSLDIEVVISVPKGDEIAGKTLNSRLGILAGISILGTTGIVRPISSEAWCATISMGMDVAKATGNDVIVLSTGRTSEKAVQKILNIPAESFILMGDYLEFSLKEAGKRGFKKVHIASQWAKLIKAAMGIPQTHVKHGALEAKKAYEFISNLDSDLRLCPVREPATVREIYLHFIKMKRSDVIRLVCQKAKDYTGGLLKNEEIFYHLVSYEGKVVESV